MAVPESVFMVFIHRMKWIEAGFRLTPIMEIKSFITYIKEIGPKTPVSYGSTFVSDKTMRVATIPTGYADGYNRALSNKGFVLIRGKRARILAGSAWISLWSM